MQVQLTASVQGDPTYVGQRADGFYIIVTESALKAMDNATYLETIRNIPELWDKEWALGRNVTDMARAKKKE